MVESVTVYSMAQSTTKYSMAQSVKKNSLVESVFFFKVVSYPLSHPPNTSVCTHTHISSLNTFDANPLIEEPTSLISVPSFTLTKGMHLITPATLLSETCTDSNHYILNKKTQYSKYFALFSKCCTLLYVFIAKQRKLLLLLSFQKKY